MRGEDRTSGALFSYVDVEGRIPAKHPLQAMRRLTNAALAELEPSLSALYEGIGRPSVPPERLLRAVLLQLLYSIRSERQLVERLEFDMLFRWFAGLSIDEKVFDASTFSKNRDRLLTHEIAQKFLSSLLGLPEVKGILSAAHFSVDGTLLKAWASMKSFRPKDASDEGPGDPPQPRRNGEVDFRRTKRSNETHASTTDKDARLFRKGAGQESRLAYLGHVLMENRNGLVAAAEATLATGTAEREAAAAFSQRLTKGATLGADKGYDAEAFVEGLKARGIEPHIAINGTVSKWQDAQDRRLERGRRECALCGQSAAAQAHRGRFRLDEDGRRSHAGEGARPRQGPRRFRLGHGRLQHRPPAQAHRPEERGASGDMRTVTRPRARTSNISPIHPQKIAPASPAALSRCFGLAVFPEAG
jgi:transposase